MSAPRDLVAEARTKAVAMRADFQPATARLLGELADEIERLTGMLVDIAIVEDQRDNARTERDGHRRGRDRAYEVNEGLRAQRDEIRTLAATWAAQVPVDDAAVQQVEDGCGLLLLIDGRTLPEGGRS